MEAKKIDTLKGAKEVKQINSVPGLYAAIETAITNLEKNREFIAGQIRISIKQSEIRKLQNKANFEWGIKTGLEIVYKLFNESPKLKALTIVKPEKEIKP